MKVIVYIQADLRYSKYLLKQVNGKSIIDYTLEGVYGLENVSEIILGLFNCKENKELSYLERNYDKLKIVYSDEENLTYKMYDICKKGNAEIVVRVTGEKLFIDRQLLESHLKELIDNKYDFLIPLKDNGLLADMFRFSIFDKYKDEIMKYDRYYKFFIDNKNRELNGKVYDIYEYVTPSFYSYNVKNEFDYDIAKRIIEEKFDVKEENRILFNRLLSEDSILYTNRWIKSFLDRNNSKSIQEYLPWMSYSIINFLSERINKGMHVFEFGSGNSTLWWSEKISNLCSVEHNITWYNKLLNTIPNNVDLHYVELDYDGKYCREIKEFNKKFDIIVIDGRDRVNCAKNCIDSLKEGGVIIWDDFGRIQYLEGIKFLKTNGYRHIKFSGMSPENFTESITAIFYKDQNCLGI